jgi:hypothetical protein
LGWQATENLDEFSRLLQKWAAESPLQWGVGASTSVDETPVQSTFFQRRPQP